MCLLDVYTDALCLPLLATTTTSSLNIGYARKRIVYYNGYLVHIENSGKPRNAEQLPS